MKQRYRKLLSLILTAAMAVTLLPAAALADEGEAVDASECVCSVLCTGEAGNGECPVCKEGYANCAYKAPEAPAENPAEGENVDPEGWDALAASAALSGNASY